MEQSVEPEPAVNKNATEEQPVEEIPAVDNNAAEEQLAEPGTADDKNAAEEQPVEGVPKCVEAPTSEKKSTPEDAPVDLSDFFIEKQRYEGIVNLLKSKPSIVWVKLCSRAQAPTCEGNKKVLMKVYEDCVSGRVSLNTGFLERLTGKLKDDAVVAELVRMNKQPKTNARARKTQLLSILIDQFTTANGSEYFKEVLLKIDRKSETETTKAKKKKLRNLRESIIELDNDKKVLVPAVDIPKDVSAAMKGTDLSRNSMNPPDSQKSVSPNTDTSCRCPKQPIKTLEAALLSLQTRLSNVETAMVNRQTGAKDDTHKVRELSQRLANLDTYNQALKKLKGH